MARLRRKLTMRSSSARGSSPEAAGLVGVVRFRPQPRRSSLLSLPASLVSVSDWPAGMREGGGGGGGSFSFLLNSVASFQAPGSDGAHRSRSPFRTFRAGSALVPLDQAQASTPPVVQMASKTRSALPCQPSLFPLWRSITCLLFVSHADSVWPGGIRNSGSCGDGLAASTPSSLLPHWRAGSRLGNHSSNRCLNEQDHG